MVYEMFAYSDGKYCTARPLPNSPLKGIPKRELCSLETGHFNANRNFRKALALSRVASLCTKTNEKLVLPVSSPGLIKFGASLSRGSHVDNNHLPPLMQYEE
ncbi:hypothetical protein CEXT_614991 [Caerostris extrusa]|uniref:Uncharacterized protein n=1 Tax=Caerostris extrusa TaxID=172846 RepID=A0AAV4RV92_CAEEX|nr:hypothetical protein CEXT_614991 [Caerostris extrusa]